MGDTKLYLKPGNYKDIYYFCGVDYLMTADGKFIAAHNIITDVTMYNMTYVYRPECNVRLFVGGQYADIKSKEKLVMFRGRHYKSNKNINEFVPLNFTNTDTPLSINTMIHRILQVKFMLGSVACITCDAMLAFSTFKYVYVQRDDCTMFEQIDDWSVKIMFADMDAPILGYLKNSSSIIDKNGNDICELGYGLSRLTKFTRVDVPYNVTITRYELPGDPHLVLEDDIGKKCTRFLAYKNALNQYILICDQGVTVAYEKKIALHTKPADFNAAARA